MRRFGASATARNATSLLRRSGPVGISGRGSGWTRIPSWPYPRVGDRGPTTAYPFMQDVASRLKNRVQLTTDGHSVHFTAVERAFGWNGVDYSMLVKLYSADHGPGGRLQAAGLCRGRASSSHGEA